MFIRLAGESLNLKKALIPCLALLLFSFNAATATPVLSFINSNILFLWGPDFGLGDVTRIAYMAAIPFVVIYLGRDLPPLLTIKDDISYGVYIYGWPVAQVIVYFEIKNGVGLGPYFLFFVGTAVAAALGWLSWRLIEKQAMRLKISKPRTVMPTDVNVGAQ